MAELLLFFCLVSLVSTFSKSLPQYISFYFLHPMPCQIQRDIQEQKLSLTSPSWCARHGPSIYSSKVQNHIVSTTRELLTWRVGPFLPYVILVMTVGSDHLLYVCITAAGNAISSQLSSSGRSPARQYGSMERPSQYKSHLPGHFPSAKPGRTPCRASLT